MIGVSHSTIEKILNGGVITKRMYNIIANSATLISFNGGIIPDNISGHEKHEERLTATIAKARSIQAEREKGKVLVKVGNGTWVLRRPDDVERPYEKRSVMCYGKGYEEKIVK